MKRLVIALVVALGNVGWDVGRRRDHRNDSARTI